MIGQIESYSNHSGSVTCLLPFPDFSFLASGSDDFWEALETGCKQANSTLRDPSSSTRINSLAYLGNGILATGYENKKVNVWNIYTGSLVNQYTHWDAVLSLASLNNGYLVGGSRGAAGDNLKLWRVF
jgi:WD40 repeat protein